MRRDGQHYTMKKILFGLAITVFFSFNTNSQTFRAGAAVRVITPDPLLPVSGGIGTPRPVTIKQGELYVRALVLEKGATRVAIVNIDNLGWPAALGNRSRKLITGIPAENILIGATHTHSGPDAYGFPDENGKSYADLKYLDWCVQQVADAVNEAIKKLQPASLKTAVGEAKGKIAYNYYAPDLYDPRCGIIQPVAVSGKNAGKPIATLVNYAIHPEVIGSRQGILSPDLCGPLYERIEEKGGGIALFMNGAQGGMVTADARIDDKIEANHWAECGRIGRLLADEALRIVSDAPLQPDPDLYCAAKTIRFPIASPVMKYILANSPLKLAGDNPDKEYAYTQLNLLNIGQVQVVTIPGEALPNIGYYVKRNMKTKQPFLFGLTNDAFGYMLTREDFNSFKKYEYVSRTSLGEMTGDIYINEALKVIAESPAAQGYE